MLNKCYGKAAIIMLACLLVLVGFGYTGKDIVMAGRSPYMKWWERESEELLSRAYKADIKVEHDHVNGNLNISTRVSEAAKLREAELLQRICSN